MAPHDDLEIANRLNQKVERANNHILNLQSEWSALLQTDAYKASVKHDFDNSQCIYWLERCSDIPPRITVIVGDVLQNLRSALDHVAYHLVSVGSGKGSAASFRVYFPIAETAAKYQSESPGKTKGMRKDAIDAINAVEPYGGGTGDLLWILHLLNNIDKHRLLVTAVADMPAHSISPAQFARGHFPHAVPEDQMWRILVGASRSVFPLKAGDILLTIPMSQAQQKMQFRIVPAFGEPRIVEGRLILPTLREMMNVVRGLICQFAEKGLYV